MESASDDDTKLADTAAAKTAEAGVAALAYAEIGETPVDDYPDTGTVDVGDDGGDARRWLSAAGVAAIIMSAAAAVAVGIIVIGHKPAPAPTAPALPVHVLDGTYRLDIDVANQTVMGSPNPNDQKQPETVWRAFRSRCAGNACAAASVALDNTNHQSVDGAGPTNEWQWVGDHWQSQLKRVRVGNHTKDDPAPAPFICTDTDKKTGIAEDTHVFTTSLEPQPDGTLKGVQTDTIVSNECGRIGRVGQMPVLATRVGGVAPSISVPDPKDAATTAASPGAPTPGPALNGIYRLNFEGSQDRVTVNGVRQPSAESGGKDDNETWVFRSLCTPTGCVATGALVDATNNGEAQGAVAVFRFAENRWQGSQITMLIPDFRRCGVTGQGETVSGRDLQPQPNGTITGTKTYTVTDNFCGHGETTYSYSFTATQLAATVPSTVVLADPALFAT